MVWCDGAYGDSFALEGRGGSPFLKNMDISLILKVAGIGILVAVTCQILGKYGRDEQSMFVGMAGIIVVLLLLVGELSELFETVKDHFGL